MSYKTEKKNYIEGLRFSELSLKIFDRLSITNIQKLEFYIDFDPMVPRIETIIYLARSSIASQFLLLSPWISRK